MGKEVGDAKEERYHPENEHIEHVCPEHIPEGETGGIIQPDGGDIDGKFREGGGDALTRRVPTQRVPHPVFSANSSPYRASPTPAKITKAALAKKTRRAVVRVSTKKTFSWYVKEG